MYLLVHLVFTFLTLISTYLTAMLIFPKRADNNFRIEHREAFRHLTHPLSMIFSSLSAGRKIDLIAQYESAGLTTEELELVYSCRISSRKESPPFGTKKELEDLGAERS